MLYKGAALSPSAEGSQVNAWSWSCVPVQPGAKRLVSAALQMLLMAWQTRLCHATLSTESSWQPRIVTELMTGHAGDGGAEGHRHYGCSVDLLAGDPAGGARGAPGQPGAGAASLSLPGIWNAACLMAREAREDRLQLITNSEPAWVALLSCSMTAAAWGTTTYTSWHAALCNLRWLALSMSTAQAVH